MKKLILFSFLLLSISASSQFKFGAIGGIGVGSNSEVAPLDSFTAVYGAGPLVEYAGYDFSIRSGVMIQSNQQLLIPLQLIIKINRDGGFVGIGASYNALQNGSNYIPGTYDLILGNKVSRNIDISLGFSYPMKGALEDAIIQIRMCIFPLSTCDEVCGY